MAPPADTNRQAEEAWRTAVAKVLKGGAADALTTLTRDGLPAGPLFPAADKDGAGPWRERGQIVGILQRLDHPEPEQAKALAGLDLDNGATGLVLVGAGSATARGFGLRPADLPEALDSLPLWSRTVRLEFAPVQAHAAVDALLALAHRDGYAPEAVDFDLGFDPLDHADALQGTVATLRDRGVAGAILRADGRVHHEAGASEAQELAAVLSAGVTALRALEPLGLETARDAISFTLAAEADLLLTIAKLRAVRQLWARVENACGLAPRPMRLHAETAWRMLARRDPYTNVLRSTIATAAAVLGGADSMTVLPFTNALGLPDVSARRLARNTALVLLQESNLARVRDPAAGAGAFEAVTDGLAREAWAAFQDLERQGGLAAALASGAWPRAIAAMRAKRRNAIADGQASLVGVTHFVNPSESLLAVLSPAPDVSGASASGLPSGRDAEAFEHMN